MPGDVYDHLELRPNRCRIVILADTALSAADCADKLLSYGSIKEILTTIDSRAAFVEFACEHAPLLVARCYVYHKANAAVPMPTGMMMLLPGCSVNNFLYCCVPPALPTLALKRFFCATSGLEVTVHRPGVHKRAFVEFHGAPPAAILNRAGGEPVPFTVHVNKDTFIVYAVPFLPALTDYSGLLDSDGCEDCNVAFLRPMMLAEEGDGLTQHQRDLLLPPKLHPIVAGPPLGHSTPASSPPGPPPQRPQPVRIDMPQQRAPRFSGALPVEEQWDDVPDPAAAPIKTTTREEKMRKQVASPFVSADENVFLAPHLPRLSEAELAPRPRRKLHAIVEEREEEQVLPVASPSSLNGDPRWDDVLQTSTPLPRELTPSPLAQTTRDEQQKEESSRDEQGLCHIMPTIALRRAAPSASSFDWASVPQKTSPSRSREERRRERREEMEQDAVRNSSSTMPTIPSKTTSVPGLIGAPMETFDAAAMRRDFERGGAVGARDSDDLEAEETKEMYKRLARTGWPVTYTSDEERQDDERRRDTKQRQIDFMQQTIKERAEKKEKEERGSKQQARFCFSAMFPATGSGRGSVASSSATSVESSPSTLEEERREARRARRARQSANVAVDERQQEDVVVEESARPLDRRADDVTVEKTGGSGEGEAEEMEGSGSVPAVASDATTQSSRTTSPLSKDDEEERRRRRCGDEATTTRNDDESKRVATTTAEGPTSATSSASSTTTSSEEEERDSDDLLSGEEDRKWMSAGPCSLSGLSHASTMDSLWSAAAETAEEPPRRRITPEEEEAIRRMVRGLAEAAIVIAEAKSSPQPSPTVSLVHEDTASSAACEEEVDESEQEEDTQADYSDSSSDAGTLLHAGSSDEGTVSDASEDTLVGDSDAGFFADPDDWDEADKAKYGVRERLLQTALTSGTTLSTIEEEEDSQEEDADFAPSSIRSGSSAVDQGKQSTVDTVSEEVKSTVAASPLQ